MHPPRCYYSRLSQAASCWIQFSKILHGFEYLYGRDRSEIILGGVEILLNMYAFPSWALDSRESQTDREGDWSGGTETSKNETKVKDNDTGARSVREASDHLLRDLSEGKERMMPNVWIDT